MFEASCLDFSLAGEEGISLASAWPVSDEEGRAGTGYVFTVTNNCDRDIDYIIGLESLEVEENPNYIDNQYLRIAIDDEVAKNLSSLNVIDNITSIGDSESIIETRQVITSTLKAYGSNEHVVKMWLSIDTPLSEQSKTFKSRIVVTGGQGIKNTSLKATADKCFTIDENGQITAYNIADSDCSENVVIPARVNDIKVKTIDTDAFRGTKKIYNYTYYVVLDSSYSPLYVTLLDLEKEATLLAWAEANGYSSLPYYKDGEQPALESGQHVQYCTFDSSNNPQCGNLDETPGDLYTTSSSILITGLDLSKAIYLDTIEDSAFSNVPASVTDLSTYSNYDISLTSLAFGENGKDIKLGHNAFARISVDDLTTYASYYTGVNAENSDMLTPLGGATIQNLVIKPTSLIKNLDGEINADTSEVKTPIYVGMTVNNMTISEGITSWLNSAFDYGTLGTVNLPNSMDFSLGSHFSFVNSIDKLVLPSRLTVVPESAFSNIKATSVVLPNTLERIEKDAFYKSTITSLNTPNSLTYIGEKAFALCPLTSLTLSNSLTYIGRAAFYYARLSTVTIPLSVTTIESKAFYSHSSYPLNTIIFKGRTDTSGMTLSSDYILKEITTEVFEP